MSKLFFVEQLINHSLEKSGIPESIQQGWTDPAQLPDELRENEELNVDNEIMEFNLFEVKFANESMVDQNEDNSY